MWQWWWDMKFVIWERLKKKKSIEVWIYIYIIIIIPHNKFFLIWYKINK